jgi:hypothetical protein
VLEIEKCLMVPSYQTLPIDLTPNQPVEMRRLGPRITRELKGYHHFWEWEWEWSGVEAKWKIRNIGLKLFRTYPTTKQRKKKKKKKSESAVNECLVNQVINVSWEAVEPS